MKNLLSALLFSKGIGIDEIHYVDFMNKRRHSVKEMFLYRNVLNTYIIFYRKVKYIFILT